MTAALMLPPVANIPTPRITFTTDPSFRRAGRGRIQLCEAMIVVDAMGPTPRTWTVPIGYVSDGESNPVWSWAFIGSNYSGKLIRPGIFHDYLCDQPELSSIDCAIRHREALRCEGVGTFRREVSFLALRYFWKQWKAKV